MSHQRHPFDVVLGAVGNVRVLRALATFGGSLPAMRVADECRMSLNGTLNALALLEGLGIVGVVGSGRIRLYHLQTKSPLGAAVAAMFAAEHARFDTVLEGVKQASDLPGVVATWLFGSVARGEDGPESDIDVALVIDRPDREVSTVADAVRDRLAPLADAMALRPSVVSLSVDQAKQFAAQGHPFWATVSRDVLVVSGCSPEELTARGARKKATA